MRKSIPTVERLEDRLVLDYSVATSYSIGGALGFTVQGQLNSGTDPDLAALKDAATNKLVVLLGGNGATFGSPSEYTTTSHDLYHVALGDMDGDGDQDAVVAGSDDGGSEVAVHLNNGSGDFSTYNTFSITNGGAYWVTVADVDGDSDRDIMVAGYSYITKLVNGGSGTSFTQSSFSATCGSGNTAEMVGLVGLDGDSDYDLVINSPTVAICTRLNGGSGDFASASETEYAMSVGRGNIADLDGDGDADLIGTRQQTGEPLTGYIRYRLNNGSGSFGSETEIQTSRFVGEPEVFDVDGDSDMDIVVTDAENDRLRVFKQASGSFTEFENYVVSDGMDWWIAFGDWDGDGDVDLAIPLYTTDYIDILTNDGTW